MGDRTSTPGACATWQAHLHGEEAKAALVKQNVLTRLGQLCTYPAVAGRRRAGATRLGA